MPRMLPPEGLVICNLKDVMLDRGLTVAETARLTNLSRPTVRKLRQDPTSVVDTTTVAKLCHGLQLGIGVLFVHRTKDQLEAWKKVGR